MLFLTEEDIRARAPQAGSVLVLGPDERLTPSATEYANQLRLKTQHGCPETAPTPACAESSCSCAASGSEAAGHGPESTWLDAETMVPKNHPAVIMRGKLDTLLAHVVLVQTQFDPKDRQPVFLKQCLTELHTWVMSTLGAEMTGNAVKPEGMGGMDMEALHAVSREPEKYLGIGHLGADASMGGNIALLNWLRAVVRETEVTAVACSANLDVICSLNRLSSAVYVLMLLTHAAERGLEIGPKKKG